jgi:hypothetical protein
MSSLRELFQEALVNEDSKTGGAPSKNPQIRSFVAKKKSQPKGKAGAGYKGNPWHAGKTGRFTKYNREKDQVMSLGVGTGNKYRKAGGKWDQITTNCGSDDSNETTGIKGKSKGRSSKNPYSKGPDPERGTCMTNGKGGGKGVGTPEGKEQILNLIRAKKKAEKGKGKGQKGAAAIASSYDSDDLFLARLFEGGDNQHPLNYVDGARGAANNALEALYAMPDGEDYDEVVEAAEHLSYVADLLDYEEGYDEE